MFNIILADIHRLRHGKAVPLTFLILMLGVFGGSMLSDAPAPLIVTTEFILIMPFILALVYAVCAPDFNHSTIKNSVATGIPRGKIYAARLILSTVLSEVLLLCAVAVNYLAKLVAPPPLEVAPAGTSLEIVIAVASLCFMVFAMVACGCAIAFITRRGAILNVVFLGLFIGVQIVVSLVAGSAALEQLMSYEFMYNTSVLGYIQVPTDGIIRALSVGAVYLVVGTVLGVLLFRRAELK
jgi:hypothetical protein